MSRTAPLLPVDLLRIPLFALSVATSICVVHGAVDGAGVDAVPVPEHGLGMDQVMTGLLMTPWPLTVAVIAPFAGRLADRYPAGLLGGCGHGGAWRWACWRWRCCRRIRRGWTSPGG